MPFGLQNAANTFQRFINEVVRGMNFVFAYVDDLLVASNVIFWPSTRPKNAIPRWYTGRKWHIPMASNRKRSRGRIKAYDMGQGEGPIVPLQWCTGRE